MLHLESEWVVLPGVKSFLKKSHSLMSAGGVIVVPGTGMPKGFSAALKSFLRGLEPHLSVSITPDETSREPADILARAFACESTPTYQLVHSEALNEKIAIIENVGAESLVRWESSFQEFKLIHEERAHAPMLILSLDSFTNIPESMEPCLFWEGVSRVDSTIWADHHMFSQLDPPLGEMREALATELGNWDLPLVEKIAGATSEEVIDPRSMLTRLIGAVPELKNQQWSGETYVGTMYALCNGKEDLIDSRIWRAQLRVLFPWLEDFRQNFVEKYKEALYVDEHSKKLGAKTIQDLEFGSIIYCLKNTVSRRESELLEDLRNIRNSLAHRKPVIGEHILSVINLCRELELYPRRDK